MTESTFIAAGVGAFFSIFRFSIDLLIDLSQRVSTGKIEEILFEKFGIP